MERRPFVQSAVRLRVYGAIALALLKAKEELTAGATGGDLIKAAAEILIATLKTEGHTALVGLAFNIISTLYIAAESHDTAATAA